MEPYFSDDLVTLYLGDCRDVLRTLEADSIDAIVTDPPAGIAFMDREWDDFRRARNPADAGRDNVFGRRDRRAFVDMLTARLAEAYRVLKPGGHALVWAIPRTSHWTAWAIEDAGFDLRDCVLHLFGSGFPKSLDVSKAIDKAAGAEREITGSKSAGQSRLQRVSRVEHGYRENLTACTPENIPVTAPATEDAARWAGFGTALKPGQEMWWLARKPFRGTVAANILEYGTGALNIDGCRVAHASEADRAESEGKNRHADFGSGPREHNGVYQGQPAADRAQYDGEAGRWPANIVLTHSATCEPVGMRRVRGSNIPGSRSAGGQHGAYSPIGAQGKSEMPIYADPDGTETVQAWDCAPDCPAAELDRQSGATESRIGKPRRSSAPGNGYGMVHTGAEYADAGGASRFYPTFRYQAKAPSSERPRLDDGTAHETVKSLGLMSWLVRLITPPGGTVLDMFAGSGPTAEACIVEGFRCVLIEQDPKSAELIRKRLSKPIQPAMFGLEAG